MWGRKGKNKIPIAPFPVFAAENDTKRQKRICYFPFMVYITPRKRLKLRRIKKMIQKEQEIITMEIQDNGGDPVIPPGARVFCSEDIPVSDGDYILVKRKDDAPLVRLYTIRSDGAILLKSMNRNADSYVTTASGLKNTGYYVVLRSEYDFVASKRLLPGLLARAEAIANGQEVPPLAPQTLAAAAQENALAGNESELLTFDEALAALKVRRTKMYALLRSGALSAVKIGKLWRIERSAIKEYLDSIKSGN